MAFVKCECGFLKKDIPDVHIGKSKDCPKCGKNITVNSSLFLTGTNNEETAPAPIPIEATSPEPVKPDWRKIINTDVLLAVLKWHRDRISAVKYNKKILIPAIILAIIGIVLVWQSSFVKQYFFKKEVITYLKNSLKDPDSLKIIEWIKLESIKKEEREKSQTLKDMYWRFTVKYSATNSYGGRNAKTGIFILNDAGKVTFDYTY